MPSTLRLLCRSVPVIRVVVHTPALVQLVLVFDSGCSELKRKDITYHSSESEALGLSSIDGILN